MSIDLFSFFFGGVVILIGFLAIMAWVVPDKAASIAMTWLTSRKNFSRIGLGIGIIMLLIVIVILAIAFVKLLQYLQVDSWVLWFAAAGFAIALISIVTLIATKRRNVS
ncbi:MAG: hypothetical protein ACD_13C00281G0004 [uncultured bacterium]|nr:MAG: hypothetical protein ACD_13C00281G0004 [uncultured bacterium]